MEDQIGSRSTSPLSSSEDDDLMREIYDAMQAQCRLSEPSQSTPSSRPSWCLADAMRRESDGHHDEEDTSGPSSPPTPSPHYVTHREERLGRARRAGGIGTGAEVRAAT